MSDRHAGWLSALLLLCCQGADEELAQERGTSMPLPSEAAAQGTAPDAAVPAEFPADWCGRLDGLAATIRISNAYNRSVRRSCALAGLTATSSLSADQYRQWRGYVQVYSSLMAGCAPAEPTAGGIAVFGPANIAAVGGEREKLSPDEVMLLTEAYVQAFGDELQLGEKERDAVRSYLLLVGQQETDVGAMGSLSLCIPEAGE